MINGPTMQLIMFKAIITVLLAFAKLFKDSMFSTLMPIIVATLMLGLTLLYK